MGLVTHQAECRFKIAGEMTDGGGGLMGLVEQGFQPFLGGVRTQADQFRGGDDVGEGAIDIMADVAQPSVQRIDLFLAQRHRAGKFITARHNTIIAKARMIASGFRGKLYPGRWPISLESCPNAASASGSPAQSRPVRTSN